MENSIPEKNITSPKNHFEDFLIILVKYRKSIILNVFVVTLAAIILSIFIHNRYTAVSSFISPKQKGGLFGQLASGFSSTIQSLSRTLGGRLGNVSEEAYSYLAILKSRSASESVINKFNLREVYEIDKKKPYEDVIKELEDNVDFHIQDEGNITVAVTDKSPERAAEMANYYVNILDDISTKLGVTEAHSNREFIEKRFNQLQVDIVNVEDSLESFSKEYNVLEMKEQMKAEITAAAELTAQMEVAKIERDLLKNNYGSNSPLVQQADYKVNEFDKRLAAMKFGSDKNLKSSLNLFIPFEKIPETGVKYIRLTREYEIQTKLLEFIYPIYEQAKIQEQEDIPAVLVVDKAIPPEKKSSPKRSLIVLAAFLISFLFSVGYALLKESYSSLKEDESRYRKIQNGIVRPLKATLKLKSKNS